MAVIVSAQVNLSNNPFSMSAMHDSAVITACVASIVLAFAAPLCVVERRDSMAEVFKTMAQTLVWMLTLVSLFWAGRIALELLLRSEWKFKDTVATSQGKAE